MKPYPTELAHHSAGLVFLGVAWSPTPSAGMVVAGDVTVPCPDIPDQHVPGGVAGSAAPSRIRLAAPVEAVPAPAKDAR